MSQASIANADISEMVIEEDMMGLRHLVSANSTKKSEGSKEGGDGDGDSGDEDGHGAPDEKSMAGDEEDELAAK
jgi:hypothetical protein